MATASLITGPVTLDEVRVVVGDGELPGTTALRALLGDRGSFATLGKFLNVIKSERAPVAPVTDSAAPAGPADALAAIWSAAYTAAQLQTLGRLETITAERDSLTAALADTTAERDDLAAAADALTMDNAAAVAASEAAKASLEALEQEVQRIAEEDGKAATERAHADARAVAELEKIKSDAVAAAELQKRDFEIERVTMQRSIDSLMQQLSDVKSLLHTQAASASKS